MTLRPKSSRNETLSVIIMDLKMVVFLWAFGLAWRSLPVHLWGPSFPWIPGFPEGPAEAQEKQQLLKATIGCYLSLPFQSEESPQEKMGCI